MEKSGQEIIDEFVEALGDSGPIDVPPFVPPFVPPIVHNPTVVHAVPVARNLSVAMKMKGLRTIVVCDDTDSSDDVTEQPQVCTTCHMHRSVYEQRCQMCWFAQMHSTLVSLTMARAACARAACERVVSL